MNTASDRKRLLPDWSELLAFREELRKPAKKARRSPAKAVTKQTMLRIDLSTGLHLSVGFHVGCVCGAYRRAVLSRA